MLAEIAHFAGGQGVGGSNPLAPTINPNQFNLLGILGSGPRMSSRAPKAAESRVAAQKPPPKSPPDVRAVFSRPAPNPSSRAWLIRARWRSG